MSKKIPKEVLREAWIAGVKRRREFPTFVPDRTTMSPEKLWEEDPEGYGAGIEAALKVVLKWQGKKG